MNTLIMLRGWLIIFSILCAALLVNNLAWPTTVLSGHSVMSGSVAIDALETAPCPGPNTYNVQVGAIRWNPWYGTSAVVVSDSPNYKDTTAFQANGATTYYYRLPFFATVTSGVLTEINGNTQTVMDAEIAYAAEAGIDFWAFLDQTTVPEQDAINGLERSTLLYLSSTRSTWVKFSQILTAWSSYQYLADATAYVAKMVTRLTDSRFLRNPGGQPVVYAFVDICDTTGLVPPPPYTSYCNAAMFTAINSGVHAILGVNPYWIMLVDPANTTAYNAMRALGVFSADGVYAYYPASTNYPYTSYAAEIQPTFNGVLRAAAVTNSTEVSFFASTEWNPNPRFNCSTFGADCYQSLYGASTHYVNDASPVSDIADHIGLVASLTDFHATAQPGFGFPNALSTHRTMLIYAWNEVTESGGLQPRLVGNTIGGSINKDRVTALKAVLRPSCP